MTELSDDDSSSDLNEVCRRNDMHTAELTDSSDSCNMPVPIDSSGIDLVKPTNPPPSRMERVRDQLLDMLGGKVHTWIALIVVLLVLIDGAFFFLLLIGAHNMCDSPSRWNCNPRNDWYNRSIQGINVLLTYCAIVSLPWKLAHATHLSNGKRSCDVGLDLYGRPTDEIWFHICPQKRRRIVAFLIANSLLQYANQASRVVYYNYELQSTYPGMIWTVVFFIPSFLCAMTAGACQVYEETKLRKQDPRKFPPGPVEIGKEYLRVVCCYNSTATRSSAPNDEEEEVRDAPNILEVSKEERERRKCFQRVRRWFASDKTSLEMWGL